MQTTLHDSLTALVSDMNRHCWPICNFH